MRGPRFHLHSLRSLRSAFRFGGAAPAKERGSFSSLAVPLGFVSFLFSFSRKVRFQLENSPNPFLPAGQMVASFDYVKDSRHAAVDGGVARV